MHIELRNLSKGINIIFVFSWLVLRIYFPNQPKLKPIFSPFKLPIISQWHQGMFLFQQVQVKFLIASLFNAFTNPLYPFRSWAILCLEATQLFQLFITSFFITIDFDILMFFFHLKICLKYTRCRWGSVGFQIIEFMVLLWYQSIISIKDFVSRKGWQICFDLTLERILFAFSLCYSWVGSSDQNLNDIDFGYSSGLNKIK